jgi:S-adenosylmethionine decarboxylase
LDQRSVKAEQTQNTPLASSTESTPQESSIFGTMGRHVIADLSGCNPSFISSVSYVQKVLEEAVKRAKATIISSRFHQFSPVGVSGIILLSESHCSIHTWPDEEYAAIDIYTCGEHVFPQVACDYIAKELSAKEMHVTSVERGLKAKNSKIGNAYTHEIKNIKRFVSKGAQSELSSSF